MRCRMFVIVGFILWAGLLGGCHSGTRMANPAINGITWQGGGKTWLDTLELRTNGRYVRLEANLLYSRKTEGQWEVVSAEKQLIVLRGLDGVTPMRLYHLDRPYREWEFYRQDPHGFSMGEVSTWVAKQEAPKRDLPDQDKDISYLLRP